MFTLLACSYLGQVGQSSFPLHPILEFGQNTAQFLAGKDSFRLATSGKGEDLPLMIISREYLNPIDLCLSKNMKGDCLIVSRLPLTHSHSPEL